MDGLPMYAIYKNPRDYPGKFVTRRWVVLPGGEVRADSDPRTVANNIAGARAAVPRGSILLNRHPLDDACIVEVWL